MNGALVAAGQRSSISWKQRMRSVADRFSAGTGLLSLCERQMRNGLTILMYHRVLPMKQCLHYPLPSLAMPVSAFREQVCWLASHCEVLTVSHALEVIVQRRRPRTRPLVAVTFDDGYADNAEIAAPVLEAHGVHGTFFVTTGFVETGSPLWFDRAACAWQHLSPAQRSMLLHRAWNGDNANMNVTDNDQDVDIHQWMHALKRTEDEIRSELVDAAESAAVNIDNVQHYRPMTPEHVRTMHENGHEIASHSVTHPILTQLDNGCIEEELITSRNAIRNWTGAEQIGFAYPNGDVDQRVEGLVRRAGYAYGCTTHSGLNRRGVPMTRLARVDITRHRTLNRLHQHDEIAFRAELCRLREWWRAPNTALST